jgi:large subunit GTPase 1
MPRNQGTSRKGKPKKHERAAGMGRALQKSRAKKHTPSSSEGGMAMRKDVQSLNIEKEDNRASVLQMNDLDDFLVQAEMANRDFVSERERFVVLDPTTQAQEYEEKFKTISWDDQRQQDPEFAFQELSVPRRPAWDVDTTPEELDRREKETFLEWRRAIAEKEEEITLKSHTPLGVTPFEKNLEIWRQLWRVMERCSVIVQIVDARNPLFYLSQDLRKYATEELGKPMILLINKSDYLSPRQRQAWHDYLSHPDHQWEHLFFSAVDEQKRLDEEADLVAMAAAEDLSYDISNDIPDDLSDEEEDSNEEVILPEEQATQQEPEQEQPKEEIKWERNSAKIGIETPLTREELTDWLMGYAQQYNCEVDSKHSRMPFGMVGFPNVGKSSVINVLMGNTKNSHGVTRVGVAVMPGKTKHFQTLLLPDREDMSLCDCPGLVFPSFVNNTADLIAAGVYPISQMRDVWPVMNLLVKRIPREVLNVQYSIQIPLPDADAMLKSIDGSIPGPTAEDFLNTYCVARSMLASSSGVPDVQRASRVIIKEYAAGKLLYCHSPPTFDNDEFQKDTRMTAIKKHKKLREKLVNNTPVEKTSNRPVVSDGSDNEDDLDEGDMLLDMVGESMPSSKQNNPTRTKKWGKKGRKLRNKDPYGCFTTPDETLNADGALPMGVSVNSGKYGKSGYTRSTTYHGARSAGLVPEEQYKKKF